MGSTYFFQPEDGLFVTAYWGRTTLAESNEMRRARAADPDRLKARVHLIDLSEYTGTNATPEAETELFRALGTVYPDTFGDVPTIIIAPRAEVFGQARIFETSVSQQHGPGVKVVRSWKEAEVMTGADLTKVKEEIGRRKAAETG
jgi:hypothetical protein